MSNFQIVTVSICSILALRTLFLFFRKKTFFFLFYTLIWAFAIYVLCFPDFSTQIAKKVGIGRGSDLVTYALLLFLLWCHFQQYMRYRNLEHKLTLLVRDLAIKHPLHVPDGCEKDEA